MATGYCSKTDILSREGCQPLGAQNFPAICVSCGSCSASNHSNDDAGSAEKGFCYQNIASASPMIQRPSVQGQEQREFSRRQQRRRKVKRCLTFFCLFFLSVVTSTAICLLMLKYVRFSESPDTRALSNRLTRICVPCGPSGKPVSAGGHGTAATETLTCCSQDEAQMRELVLEGVKLSLQERLKGEDLYNLLNNPLLPPPINRNAAHVYLRNRASKKSNRRIGNDDDEFNVIKTWSSEGNTAFIRQGIEYSASQGHFVIKEAGIYVVYCRIVFENQQQQYEDAEEQDEQRIVLGHSISSFARDNYRGLLEDEQLTQCPSGGVCYNSQIFSTLHLSKDMTIAIRVRHFEYLSQSFQASYFGIYKID